MIKTSPYGSSRSTYEQTEESFQAKIKKYLELSKKIYSLPDGPHRIEKDNLIQDINIVGGKKNGAGKLTTQNGRTYHLNFIDNIPQGSARLVDAQGNTLLFTVKDGSPIGDATEILKESQIQFTFRFNGLRHGEAIETNSYGTIEYKYINGVRQLPAKITGKDKKIYYLYYFNGKPNGQAKIFLPNNKIIYCNYNNGYPEGKAQMTLPNKNEIYFNYYHGIPHGEATENFPKGYAKFNVDQGKITYPIQFNSNRSILLGVADNRDKLIELKREYGSEIDEDVLVECLYVVRSELPVVDVDELNIPPISSLLENCDKPIEQNNDFRENTDWINLL